MTMIRFLKYGSGIIYSSCSWIGMGCVLRMGNHVAWADSIFRFREGPFGMNGLLNLRAIVLAVFLLACTADAVAQVPTMGAQVWIEPGQTPKEIDLWFAQLEQARMPVARVFLMWSYLEPKRERWDFTLYDCAFRSAQKHH